MFDTDTLTGSLAARYLMVGDLIKAPVDPDALMVLAGPSGVVRVKHTPEITYAYGYVPCVDFIAENEFGGIGVVTIDAAEFVTHYGREV
jgi:hypothetical protein